MGGVVAVIPARKGSRRLPGKNTAEFCGRTLVEHKILQLRAVPEVEEVVVSSDCPEIRRLAAGAGARAEDRPAPFCDEVSKTWGQMVAHVCANLDCDDVMIAPCTAPLVTPDIYGHALRRWQTMREEGPDEPHDSLVAVHPLQTYLWDASGPINYRLFDRHPPSQELPVVFIMTGGFFVARRADMIRWEYHHGPNPELYRVGACAAIDIDTAEDLAIARALNNSWTLRRLPYGG